MRLSSSGINWHTIFLRITKKLRETNCVGTNIMQAAKINKVKKVIHTSTSKVYGTTKYVPMDENHQSTLNHLIQHQKFLLTHGTIIYNSFNLAVVVLRPFNTFGPRQSLRAVIPTIIGQALSEQKIKVAISNQLEILIMLKML